MDSIMKGLMGGQCPQNFSARTAPARICSLHPQLALYVTANVVSAFTFLDYSNAVLESPPGSTRVLHEAARVVLNLKPRNIGSPDS